MSSLLKLYDSVIKQHDTSPYHFEKTDDCLQPVQAYNFICGDRFDLCLKMSEKSITSIHFHGFGCAVSKASTSVLAKVLEGKSTPDALQICSQFLKLLEYELDPNEMLLADEFRSFQVVREVPSRYDCAALAWHEVENFLITKR